MRIILTGHSRGLGAALCEALLGRRARVLGLARHGNPALAQKFPDALSERRLDLADADALAQFIDSACLRDFLAGPAPAVLINNAGLLQPIGPLGSQGSEAISRAIALNVAAPLMLSDAFVAATAQVDDRRILHVSSGAARSAYAGWSIYCASKAALDHHARAAREDQIRGLRVVSLAPGVIDTDMQAEIRATSAQAFPQVDRFRELQRSGQLAAAADCAARLCAYLLSARFGEQPVADLREA